jgi:glycerophosphoryl diester phosphodiesterase
VNTRAGHHDSEAIPEGPPLNSAHLLVRIAFGTVAVVFCCVAPAARPPQMGVEQVIAHRGSSLDRPENTLASMQRAIEAGATAVEIDVRTTSDGHLVILHDATLDRTTDGSGPVRDKTLVEVRQLDAGSWFDPAYAGEGVPTLKDVLVLCRDKVDVLLDLKERGEEYARAITAEVKAHGNPKRTIVGVRSVEQAQEFRRMLPQSRQLGFIPRPDAIEAFAEAGVETIRLWPRWLDGDPTLAERVRKTGARLHLNGKTGEPEETLPLLEFKPVSLITDDPARLIQTLAELQSKQDGGEDVVRVIWSGESPNRLACDTTLREMPDGSWVMVMLGGGDREPLPANRIFITRSEDRGKSWSEMEPLDFGVKANDPDRALVPTELMVHEDRCTIFFATHDGRFGDWTTWMAHSDDSCRTWGPLIPAPGKLAERTFLRNTIVTRDGRLMVPFQHYVDQPGPLNPRNGVMISDDGGQSWSVHGSIRLTDDDNYRGWAESNVVELADGTISMLIRADRLGGVLYRSDSRDGGHTWSEAYRTDIPNPGSKATLYGLGDDTVALLHNPNPKERNPLSLWISFDGMRTWPYRRDLVTWPGRLNYPDGFVSRDGRFLHFAFDDNRHRAIYVGAKLPPLNSHNAESLEP